MVTGTCVRQLTDHWGARLPWPPLEPPLLIFQIGIDLCCILCTVCIAFLCCCSLSCVWVLCCAAVLS